MIKKPHDLTHIILILFESELNWTFSDKIEVIASGIVYFESKCLKSFIGFAVFGERIFHH